MKALVYHGPGEKGWEEIPDPTIQDDKDIIVQIETTTICGSDLHILKGDTDTRTGIAIGHEGVGTIVEVGAGVKTLKVGERVVVNCMTSCGTCDYCKVGLTSKCQRCPNGDSWQLGHNISGTQAEYVRLPLGETSTFHLPEGVTDAEAVLTSDIFSTGYEIGVLAGNVSPGKSVIVIGAGPVGLAAIKTATLLSPKIIVAVDFDENRLAKAVSQFGATHAVCNNPAVNPNWQDEVRGIVGTAGADVVMEAVGIPASLEACFDLVKPGGNVANIGVHGHDVNLPMGALWTKNITITMGLVNMTTGPMMLDLIAAGVLDVKPMGTHQFKLDQMLEAYEVFGNAAKNNALKVIITK
ncbi:MAG: alcohol dehydrogenase catalytic domain-containing protein [Propionibacteriaceae bacterium]|jgi:alcohol dehydrogenase|nr:alcohol dehydrogenase catalytic domain-containing protein [Propionibacteriaceae bacterium]